MRFFIIASAFVLALGGAAPAAELPGAPLAQVPSFTYNVPGFATWAGTLKAEQSPTAPVTCPYTITYDALVTIAPAGQNPVLGSVDFTWAPGKSLAGFYQVQTDGLPSVEDVSAPLRTTLVVTYLVSSPAAGSPVSFGITLSGGPKLQSELMRVISHVTCTSTRAVR